MKKIKFFVLSVALVLIISCFSCYFVFAADQVNLEITGNGAFTVSVNGNVLQNEYIGGVKKGEEVTLTASGDDFLYWLDENQNTIQSATYTFVAEFDTSFEACFKPSEGSWIVYRNTNYTNQVLNQATYTDAEAFTEHLTAKAYKYGYTFEGWLVSVDEIKEKIEAGESYVEVTPVYAIPEGSYTISVVGGTVNNETVGAFEKDEEIVIVADTVEGKEFCHWVDSNDRIVSNLASHALCVYQDDVFTAVYKDECGQSHGPEVWLELSVEDEVVDSFAQMFVPSYCTVVEYGLIYAKGYTPADLEIDLDSVGGSIKKIAYTADAVAFVNHFTFEGLYEDRYVYARAYITYTNGESEYTVYSGEEAICAGLPDIFDEVNGIKEINDYAYDDSASLVTFVNREAKSFSLACQKYVLEGYTLYGKVNELGAVKSATYVKGSKLAHIYYSSLEKELAIVTSDSEGANLPTPVAFSGDKSKTSVTQLPGSKGETSGMGYVVRLADGSFIVYDGGYTSEAIDVYNMLVELNGNSESGIVIRAWILTHGDSDHYQALREFLSTHASKVTFECLMTAPIKKNFNGAGSTGGNVVTTENSAKALGIKVCRVHTAMVFNFCDVELEILLAPESIFAYGNPSAHRAYTDPTYEFYGRGDLNGYQNETSIISRIKASDNRKTFMALGDAGHTGADKLLALYGNDKATSYLKSDICQVAHHGCETFSLECYKVIDADIWFYPSSTYLYTNMSTSTDALVNKNQYTNGSLKGRNWYVLQQLKTMGTTHIVRDTAEAKGESGFTNGLNHQSLNK